jgi:hypothetical protein
VRQRVELELRGAIALHVFNAGFRFSFRPGPIRRAGARLDVPVATEGEIGGVKDHGAGRAIAPDHQGARIIAEDRPRHPAEMCEGGRDALGPIILSLMKKGFDEQPARVAQDRDEQEDAHPFAGDADPLLAEIDLQLIPGRALDAHRGELCGPAGPANIRDRPLHRPNADVNPALGQQPLHHDRIAAG